MTSYNYNNVARVIVKESRKAGKEDSDIKNELIKLGASNEEIKYALSELNEEGEK